LKQQVLKSKSNITSQNSTHLLEAKKLEMIAINDIQSKKINISKIFKIERDKVQLKINELLSNYNKLKINQHKLFDNNTKLLKDKIDILKKLKDEYFFKVKSEFDPFHNELSNELKHLDSLYQNDLNHIINFTLDKLNEIKIAYEIIYNINTTKLKARIVVFNETVNSLLTYQNQYKQLK